MKTNKKGFTLIELLAVIVILAIILLIATPIILNVIEEAKRGAAESSVRVLLSQVEKQYVLAGYVTGVKEVLGEDDKVLIDNVDVRNKSQFTTVELTYSAETGFSGTVEVEDKYTFTVAGDTITLED